MSVLVAEEKHGTYYYPANTDEELAKSALVILTDRWNQGYWYHDPDKLDEETLQWRPADMLQTHLGDAWPGWDVPEDERVQAINKYSKELKEKYEDDPEVYAFKSKKFKNAVHEYKLRRDYRAWYAEAKALVESQAWEDTVTFKSGRSEPRSWHLLSQRSDYEYERVELEPLQAVGAS